MASNLVNIGVVEAIMLDMNGPWPTGYTYTHIGHTIRGRRINHSITRPPTIYYTQYDKDFIAVLKE